MAGSELPQVQLVSSDRRGPDAADGGLLAMVVGRRPGCEIVLTHASISEIHACLVRRSDGLWLYDLDSRNGVRVGHSKVKEKALHHRDYVEFGSLRYEVRLTGHTAKASRAPAPASLRNTATGQIERLSHVVSLVGRRSESQLKLAGGEISHVHALLIRCPDGLVVHDLGSRTGTFVNGVPEREALLSGGDKLSFGRFEFEVQLETSPALGARAAENAFIDGPAPLTDSVVAGLTAVTPAPFSPKKSLWSRKSQPEKKKARQEVLPDASPLLEDSVLRAALNSLPGAPATAQSEPDFAETDAVDQALRFLSDKTDIMPPNPELLDLGLSAISPAASNPSPLGEGGPASGPGEGLRTETVPPLDPDHKLVEISLLPPGPAAVNPSPLGEGGPASGPGEGLMPETTPSRAALPTPSPFPEQSALAPSAITDTIAPAELDLSPTPAEAPNMKPPSSPQDTPPHVNVLPTLLRPARLNVPDQSLENSAPRLTPSASAPGGAPPFAQPSPNQLRLENELEAVRRHLAAERAALATQRAAFDALLEERHRREQEESATRDEHQRREQEQRAAHEAAGQALEALRRQLQGERDSLAESIKAFEVEQHKVDALRLELQAFRTELQSTQQNIAADRLALETQRQALADNRAALETQEQRLLTERQHVASEQQVAAQDQARLEASRRELADRRQNIEAAQAELDARLAADRESLSQNRRQLDDELAALAARQEQLAAQRAEVEQQTSHLGDLQGDLDRREADLAARESGADELTSKLENDLRQQAENVAAFQCQVAEEEARVRAAAEEEARLRADAEEKIRFDAAAVAAQKAELDAQRQALADNRAALEIEQQRLLAERQHVAAEQQVAAQDRVRLEEPRRKLSDRQQNFAAAQGDLDARLAADRAAASQNRRQLDEERNALAARQEQLAAQRAEVEKQTRRLTDLQGDLGRREAALAAGQSSADKRVAKLENDLRQHAENVAAFQRQAAQAEARRQAQLAEEQTRLRDATEKEARLKSAVSIKPSPPGESGPAGPGEGLKPRTAPVRPMALANADIAPLTPRSAEDSTVALDPPSSIFADTVLCLRAAVRGRLSQVPMPPKRRLLVTSLAAAIVILVVAAVLIVVHPGRAHNSSAPPAGPARAQAVPPTVVVTPSPLGEVGPSGPAEGVSTRAVQTDSASPAAAKPSNATSSLPESKPAPATAPSEPAPPPSRSPAAEAPRPEKTIIPGGVWPFKPPVDLTNDKPADDLRATRSWAGHELGKNISALRKAYGLRADAGPRQAIAIDLSPRLRATLNDFLPPPFAEESLSGGEPEQVTVLVFLEFLYQGNSYLVVFKRLDQTGEVVLARRGTFTLYPGAIREHTVVLDPTRSPIPEPAPAN